jgi:hypothetical protein
MGLFDKLMSKAMAQGMGLPLQDQIRLQLRNGLTLAQQSFEKEKGRKATAEELSVLFTKDKFFMNVAGMAGINKDEILKLANEVVNG